MTAREKRRREMRLTTTLDGSAVFAVLLPFLDRETPSAKPGDSR